MVLTGLRSFFKSTFLPDGMNILFMDHQKDILCLGPNCNFAADSSVKNFVTVLIDISFIDALLVCGLNLTINALAIHLLAFRRIRTLEGVLLGLLIWNWSPAKIAMDWQHVSWRRLYCSRASGVFLVRRPCFAGGGHPVSWRYHPLRTPGTDAWPAGA